MARPVTLFTGQWADLPLAELAPKVAAWGFDGLELACWGDHFEVDRALAEDGYCDEQRALPRATRPRCWALGAHLVGQAVCDPIDERHRGDPSAGRLGRRRPGGRAAAGGRADEGHGARGGQARRRRRSTGSPGSGVWHQLYSFPPNDFDEVERGYQEFAERWGPILDVFDQEGVRFGLEVHPTEIAYDFVTTREGARRGRPSRGVRDQPRPEPLRTPVPRPGGLRARVRRPHLPRPRQGREAASRRAALDPRRRTSTSATSAAAGTSSRRVTATSTSRSSSAR